MVLGESAVVVSVVLHGNKQKKMKEVEERANIFLFLFIFHLKITAAVCHMFGV